MATSDILERILTAQREVVQRARRERSVAALHAEPGWDLPRRSLLSALAVRAPAIIAECKHRSPSKGVLRDPFDPVAIAASYVAAGAAAISVLTNEEFFGGRLEHLSAVRRVSAVPVLRKDFVIDEYQIDEARAAGADAILLIVAALGPFRLRELLGAAAERDLEVLVEVHDEDELTTAVDAGAALIGVNNRNLRTFVTDLAVSERLASRLPSDRRLIAESGIATGADLVRLERSGISAFLVGETFMRATDPGAGLAAMLRERESARSSARVG